MIGNEKVNRTASFSRKNILVSRAARDSPTRRVEGIRAGAAVAALGAAISVMAVSSPRLYGGPAGSTTGGREEGARPTREYAYLG
ncbi:hypothetical protein Mro03_33530 [Microbispora rosea subsp. rosea]|nr:hypothetical protein Mro03_33530 [Microbispora rosea subsp. rosea]